MSQSPKRTTRSNSGPVNFTLADIKDLITASNKEILTGFHLETNRLNESIQSLKSQFSELKTELTHLKSKSAIHEERISLAHQAVHNLRCELPRDILAETERRLAKRENIIISGVLEQTDGSLQERRDLDAKEVISILHELDVEVIDDEIEVSRIGKISQDRPRLLRVSGLTCRNKSHALKQRRKLKASDKFKKVYINSDLTRQQQEEDKELRKELRERRGLGENVVIYNNKVMHKNEIRNFQ